MPLLLRQDDFLFRLRDWIRLFFLRYHFTVLRKVKFWWLYKFKSEVLLIFYHPLKVLVLDLLPFFQSLSFCWYIDHDVLFEARFFEHVWLGQIILTRIGGQIHRKFLPLWNTTARILCNNLFRLLRCFGPFFHVIDKHTVYACHWVSLENTCAVHKSFVVL